VATQDQAVSRNYFKSNILNIEIDSKCRFPKQRKETIHHPTPGRHILDNNEYLMRTDRVCTRLQYSVGKELGIIMAEKWNTQTAKPVCKYKNVKILWYQGINR
jgi:hypothetical protein